MVVALEIFGYVRKVIQVFTVLADAVNVPDFVFANTFLNAKNLKIRFKKTIKSYLALEIIKSHSLTRDDQLNLGHLFHVHRLATLQLANAGSRRVNASKFTHQRRAKIVDSIVALASDQLLAGVLPPLPRGQRTTIHGSIVCGQ